MAEPSIEIQLNQNKYPEGAHQAEMILVDMLSERRSWFNHMRIIDALRNIRQHAESMRKEQEGLCSSHKEAIAKSNTRTPEELSDDNT